MCHTQDTPFEGGHALRSILSPADKEYTFYVCIRGVAKSVAQSDVILHPNTNLKLSIIQLSLVWHKIRHMEHSVKIKLTSKGIHA